MSIIPAKPAVSIKLEIKNIIKQCYLTCMYVKHICANNICFEVQQLDITKTSETCHSEIRVWHLCRNEI